MNVHEYQVCEEVFATHVLPKAGEGFDCPVSGLPVDTGDTSVLTVLIVFVVQD
jgi:hypothetical protein